ncbi:epididymal-specific lipocalin-12 [Dromiciops gliroides]|uniref:epididymal-specific lipocalin-12 n=1 Tax=Dromiciops gliroides TaxID=33562 RepID=UPI001CC79CFA|nr:epididymal-specific lipocalin-12 [Dromiciops gliroides]
MAMSLLWMGLALLGILQAQAQTRPQIPAPNLSRVPLQVNFLPNEFQGTWYVVGLAGNAFTKAEEAQSKMYTTAYKLQEDNSYRVTSTLLRGNRCDKFVRTFVPKGQPGQFTLGDFRKYGLQDYTVRVMRTNYNEYAMVYFKKTSDNTDYFKITLYGRSEELRPQLKENFKNVVKSLGLTDNNILFPAKTEECIHDGPGGRRASPENSSPSQP